ncbi:sugar phosphate exchanger 3-like [Liolophura sinensis]|uniref:sugar phosphate exchanger 3-like n=1 Tax=Liolophura sinensis TaxID=3198878 RepID=UPI00315856B6
MINNRYDAEGRPSRLSHKLHSCVVFVLTFFSYALFHATRKTFSNVKKTVSSEWTPSFQNSSVPRLKPDYLWNAHHMYATEKDAEPFLGGLDTAFLISYAVGLYISGMLGDRFNMRLVLSFGMCSSALTVFMFGVVTEWTHLYNPYIYMATWILNGLFQSTGWPTVVAVMGNWFERSSRGLVFGLWSACASVGNILGAVMAANVLNYGYEYTFLLTSSVLFCGGIAIFFGLLSSPKDIGLPVADDDNPPTCSIINDADRAPLLDDENEECETTVQTSAAKSVKAVSFFTAVCLPGVALYSLSYACLKLVNYSFFFWLPFYLSSAYNWEETKADQISIWYDIGGIIGGTIAGFISDCVRKRAVVVIPMLILAIPSLLIYSASSGDTVTNAALMSVVGFFIGGVANLVSAAISADLGRQEELKGSKEGLATVTGIVDGTGSAGAAIGQILVPVIQLNLGWHAVFYVFIIMTFLTGVCIFPLFLRECKDLCTCNLRYSWYTGLTRRKPTRLEPGIVNHSDPEDDVDDPVS